jgi:dimeric dUTPase (all-alpha-NTP-PPase superfamily)
MNLAPLFEQQAKLDAVIIEKHGLQGQDLLPQKILSLQVELGELANEQRTWKFWSEDREPRLKKERKQIKEGLESFDNHEGAYEWVLEEYVDCLHFILSIGNRLKIKRDYNFYAYVSPLDKSIDHQFISLISEAKEFIGLSNDEPTDVKFILYVCRLLGLGKMLGFTWEEIEQAYYVKNEVNHERQANGY